MSSDLLSRKPHWTGRIGTTVALWAAICGVGLFADMSPRPVLLAGLTLALSVAVWLMSDGIGLAQPTDWHITDEVVNRPRGADSRVVTLEHLITDSHDSAESRRRLHRLLSTLADERLLSVRGIDRALDPAGARVAMGQDLDDFVSSTDPDRIDPSAARMSLLLNRIESL